LRSLIFSSRSALSAASSAWFHSESSWEFSMVILRADSVSFEGLEELI
jgi:hypothetical protein